MGIEGVKIIPELARRRRAVVPPPPREALVDSVNHRISIASVEDSPASIELGDDDILETTNIEPPLGREMERRLPKVVSSGLHEVLAHREQLPNTERPKPNKEVERRQQFEDRFRELADQAKHQLESFQRTLDRYKDTVQLKEIARLNEQQLILLREKMDKQRLHPAQPQYTEVYNDALEKMILRVEKTMLNHVKAEVESRVPVLQKQWAKLEARYGARLAELSAEKFPMTAELSKMSSNNYVIQRYFEQLRATIENYTKEAQAERPTSARQTEVERRLWITERLYEETEELRKELETLLESNAQLQNSSISKHVDTPRSSIFADVVYTINSWVDRILHK